MWKRILLGLMFVGLIVGPAFGGRTVKKGPGNPTIWQKQWSTNDAAFTAGECASSYSPNLVVACTIPRAFYVVPANHTLILTQLYIHVGASVAGANEKCNLELEVGLVADYVNETADIAIIQTGDGSVPDLKDAGDSSTTALSYEVAAGSWLRLRLAQRAANCTESRWMNIVLNGELR